jgi:hypothetical protein
MTDTPGTTEPTCSCGDPSRHRINHRKTINCWTYVGEDRYDVLPDPTSPHGYRVEVANR